MFLPSSPVKTPPPPPPPHRPPHLLSVPNSLHTLSYIRNFAHAISSIWQLFLPPLSYLTLPTTLPCNSSEFRIIIFSPLEAFPDPITRWNPAIVSFHCIVSLSYLVLITCKMFYLFSHHWLVIMSPLKCKLSKDGDHVCYYYFPGNTIVPGSYQVICWVS